MNGLGEVFVGYGEDVGGGGGLLLGCDEVELEHRLEVVVHDTLRGRSGNVHGLACDHRVRYRNANEGEVKRTFRHIVCVLQSMSSALERNKRDKLNHLAKLVQVLDRGLDILVLVVRVSALNGSRRECARERNGPLRRFPRRA